MNKLKLSLQTKGFRFDILCRNFCEAGGIGRVELKNSLAFCLLCGDS